MMSDGVTRCQHCGCSEIDRDPSRADAVCTGCGSVLEESIIVSEVQFSQDKSGASRAVGQLVTADGNAACGLNLGHNFGFTKESRVITLLNAKRKITDLCRKLILSDHCIDMAHQFYKIALSKRFTQGRKNAQVVAACVYLVCRQQETPHMLLDISDILQINVYELGKTYLKLQAELYINIPAIDPSLYILRFSHQLGFDDKVQEVASTATRLVQRMKRDWMHAGRRPAGLCGAALLVAARMHNFNRTVNDIIKVVKVCQATVRKRLTEFSDTPSSRLTLKEFMDIDLEEEQDPPAFKAARRKKQIELEEQKMVEAEQQITKLQKEIESSLESFKKKTSDLSDILNSSGNANSDETSILKEVINKDTMDTINEVLENDSEEYEGLAGPCKLQKELIPIISKTQNKSDPIDLDASDEPAEPVKADCKLDIMGLDDNEIDSYLLRAEEIKTRAKYWLPLNGPFVLAQKQKQEKRKKEEEENAKKEPKKKRLRQKRGPLNVSTTGEAIEKIMQQKKISLKLDYSVLKNLNAETGSATDKPSTSGEANAENKEKPAKRRKSKAKPEPVIPKSVRDGISALVMNHNLQQALEKVSDDDEKEDDFLITTQVTKQDVSSTSQTVPSVEEHTIIEDGQDKIELEDDYFSQDDDEEIDDSQIPVSQLFGNTAANEYYDSDCDYD